MMCNQHARAQKPATTSAAAAVAAFGHENEHEN